MSERLEVKGIDSTGIGCSRKRSGAIERSSCLIYFFSRSMVMYVLVKAAVPSSTLLPLLTTLACWVTSRPGAWMNPSCNKLSKANFFLKPSMFFDCEFPRG